MDLWSPSAAALQMWVANHRQEFCFISDENSFLVINELLDQFLLFNLCSKSGSFFK